MTSSEYLLAGQVSELDRLSLQSRVWEPSGRRLLQEIGDGTGVRAADIGCGVMGWLRLLSEAGKRGLAASAATPNARAQLLHR